MAVGETGHEVAWGQLWENTVELLSSKTRKGAAHLLAEGSVRDFVRDGLMEQGIKPHRLRYEYGLKDGRRLDLAIDDPPIDVIEFKFPREPYQTNPMWTEHLGGVLADTYRLGELASRWGSRSWQVLVAGRSFLNHFEGVEGGRGVKLHGEQFELTPEKTAKLASTSLKKISSHYRMQSVRAVRCADYALPGSDLRFAAYQVEPINT